jgi:hypothetical protein
VSRHWKCVPPFVPLSTRILAFITQHASGNLEGERPGVAAKRKQLDRVAALFIYLRIRESESKMAFITGSTPEGRDEKSSVKNMLQESLSSRPVDCRAGAVGTNRRLLEDSHDKHLPVSAGVAIVHPNLPSVARTTSLQSASQPFRHFNGWVGMTTSRLETQLDFSGPSRSEDSIQPWHWCKI